MELQNIGKIKNKRSYYNIYRTLGDEKKVDYQILDKSLADVKYDLDIFENFLSPKSKLSPKLHQKKYKNSILIKNKRMVRNTLFLNLSNNNLNMRNKSSSNSLDKLIKKQFSVKQQKHKKINGIKNVKKTLKAKSRNNNLDFDENKKSIFITDYKMATANYNNKEDNNPINNMVQTRNKYLKERYFSFSLNKNLPPIKAQTTNYSNNNDLKTLDNKDKIKNSKYSNEFIKTQPMIIKKNKLLCIDEEAVSNMIKKNKSIINKINTVKNKLDNDMIYFEIMYKYLNWKYGISDSNKYFIDIKTYKKDPEQLINNKKSFYDKLDETVDEINRNKRKNDMESIKKQYGIKINKKKDNVDYNSINVNEAEKLFLKGRKIKNILKELYLRKKTEKRTRRKIKSILDRSKDKYNNINKNFYNYKIKELQMNE